MQARSGDRLQIHGRTVGASERVGEILEVHGSDGQPPYLVRFEDGSERLLFPGPDCVVIPAGAQQ